MTEKRKSGYQEMGRRAGASQKQKLFAAARSMQEDVVPTYVSPDEKAKTVRKSRVVLESDVPVVKKKLFPATVRYTIGMTFFAAVILGALIFFIHYLIETQNAQQQYEEVAAEFVTPVPTDLVPTEEGGEPPDTSAWPPIVDFAALKASNPDVAGWIRIPGTSVDYPIMVSGEQDYYLTRDMNGEYSSSGAIFADFEQNPDLSDPHLVIYGHHMNVPMMFHDVYKYSDPEYLDSHRWAYLVLPEKTYLLKVIGTYVAEGTEYEARQTLFNTQQYFQGYLDERLERIDQVYRDDYDRPTLDRFVTLITCTNAGDSRQIVECVVEQEYPTEYVPNVIASALAGL